MAEANPGVCGTWIVVEDVQLCGPCGGDVLTDEQIEPWLPIATEVVWNLSGRKYSGLCVVEGLRPPGACDCLGGWDGPWLPPGVARPADLLPGCGCGCGGVSAVVLPGYPIVSVEAVTIDGTEVPDGLYRVDNFMRLTWQGVAASGRASFPCCQHLDRPAGEPGTWSVDYTHGVMPPDGGVRAAAGLACQYALSCHPDASVAGRCQLPRKVSQVTRQGTSMTLDRSVLMEQGLSGYAVADDWIASDRYGHANGMRPGVFVPGNLGRTASYRDTGA